MLESQPVRFYWSFIDTVTGEWRDRQLGAMAGLVELRSEIETKAARSSSLVSTFKIVDTDSPGPRWFPEGPQVVTLPRQGYVSSVEGIDASL